MSSNRVLILAPDADSVASFAHSDLLKDIHFIVISDWDQGVALLSQEYYSVIVARKFPGDRGVSSFTTELSRLAPATPEVGS